MAKPEQQPEPEAAVVGNRPRVLVYGTLKRGEANHALLADAVFLGESTITGAYRMVDLGWYPGVVRVVGGIDHPIVGEVFQIDEETLHSLDILEGHPNFYERIKVTTEWKGTWLYTLPPAYLEAEEIIEEGVWHGKSD